MQQTISDVQPPEEYGARRSRPMLMKRTQLVFVIALVCLDIAAVWAGYYSAYLMLQRNPEIIIGSFLEFWPLPAVNTVVLLGIFFSRGMYQRRRTLGHLDETFQIILLQTISVLFTVAIITLVFPDLRYHRSLLVLGWLFSIFFLTLLRMVHAQVQWQAQARGIGDDRVLVVGAGEIGQMLLTKITLNPKMGYQVVGVVGKGDLPTENFSFPVLGSLADIPWIIERYDVDDVIIGLPESSQQELVNIISLCEREKVGIRVFPDVFQIMATEVSIGDLGGMPLLNIRDVALQGWKLTLKRGMDIIVSGIGLVAVSPFMLMTAILIKLDSPGPVFYVQERMGLDARPFKMIKFRSMRPDAETEGPGWTTEDDPRRTKLGSMMRRFNIDELPQLINVFIGDMSLVGPRPERPIYVEQFRVYIPRYMDRHREKAGITGWAQVNGLRGDTSIAERTKYDLWYIENWSLALDFKIILQTVIQTILGTNQNAY